MIIQATTEGHKKDLLDLVYKYHELSIHHERTISYEKLERLWEDPKVLILLAYQNHKAIGFLVAYAYECPYTDTTLSNELAWYASDPRECIHLFRSYEWWAEHVAKVDVIGMGSISGESPERFYEKNGYKLINKIYQKELHNGR